MRIYIALIIGLILLAGCEEEGTNEYPGKPVRLIVNFSPGDTTDLAARILAAKAEQVLGEKIYITYRAGASGTLGISEVSRQSPDGYTFGTGNMPAIALVPQFREVPYDPFEDLTQIAAVLPYEYGIVVRSDSQWQSWQQLVDFVKAHPDEVTYGSLGAGTTNHLATARIGQELGLRWRHIPFQGNSKAMAAVLGGHIDFINSTISSVAPSITAGKLRLLMVTSANRLQIAPEVPTMKELGFDFSQLSYMSILAPGNLPKVIRDKVQHAFEIACNDEFVQDSFASISMTPHFIGGQEYSILLKRLSREWREHISELGIELLETPDGGAPIAKN